MTKRDEVGLRVLLLARYGVNGASSRVRHYNYIPLLRERGIEVTTQCLIDNESIANFYSGQHRNWLRIAKAYADRVALLRRRDCFDVVWIEKEVLPDIPAWAERSLYADRRVATVLDFDDLWISRRRRLGLSGLLQRREVEKLKRASNAATVVTASNPYLAGFLEAETGRRPTVLYNCIDVQAYARAAAASRSYARPGKVRLGWIGTSYTAGLYLPAIAPVLNRLSAEGLTTTVLIGAGRSAPEVAADRLVWDITREPEAIASTDVGIQPLGDSDFDRCKSGWKLYQFMAAGKPVVASRVGYTAELIEDGQTGFLAGSNEEFEHRLRLLATNRGLREEMGRRAQSMMAEKFKLETGADRLAELFWGLDVTPNFYPGATGS